MEVHKKEETLLFDWDQILKRLSFLLVFNLICFINRGKKYMDLQEKFILYRQLFKIKSVKNYHYSCEKLFQSKIIITIKHNKRNKSKLKIIKTIYGSKKRL